MKEMVVDISPEQHTYAACLRWKKGFYGTHGRWKSSINCIDQLSFPLLSFSMYWDIVFYEYLLYYGKLILPYRVIFFFIKHL